MLEHYNVILVDDDPDVLQAYQMLLKEEGYFPKALIDPTECLTYIHEDWNGIVISDIYMPHFSGWTLLTKIHQKDPHIPVILITGHGDVPMAIDAMQKGAYYFIEKPVQPQILLQQLAQALEKRNSYLTQKLWQKKLLESNLIGQSLWSKQLRRRIQQLAETQLPLFIFGEIGTGKTLVADYFYQLCKERYSTYHTVVLNDPCDNDLLQNIEKLTGAVILIENSEHLSLKTQKYLAQILIAPAQTNRFILTSLYSPKTLLTQYKLLPELFYHIAQTQIELIPLHQRHQDIELLFRYYLDLICKKLNKKRPIVSEKTVQQLLSQRWEGNIHQLIHSAELYAVGATISPDQLQLLPILESEISLDSQLETYEKGIISAILDRFQGNINATADYLKIPRKKLYLRMKKYGINKEDYKA
ncbi:sigma-54-dependent transcriptional regulator [Histophilus somni]|uniref:sigma-54-dependent transcriptional regulator n=1 Tax=Histophilus somni TaxID=731 RepID=UPI00201EAA41|nr:sigma-54 dependent transcriptional regulator [Histophilus somni]